MQMHMQIRVDPSMSPPSVAKLLQIFAEEKLNLLGAGGSNIEFGGEFAFAVSDENGDEERAKAILDREGYRYRVFHRGDPEFTLCWLTNEPGQLESCLDGVTAANDQNGRAVRDILVGVAEERGIPVQVFSESAESKQAAS
jgi:hypothetical protein